MVYSIIKKSKLEGTMRLDAEYYQPEYLDIEKKLDSVETKTVEEISESVVSFGAYSLCNFIEWQEEGVPYLNVQNIKNGFIDFEGVRFIDEKVDKILKKSKVEEGQVLLTMAGTIGNVAVAHNIPKKVNSNQATAKITLKEKFSPFYLSAFLNCKYGKEQTIREIISSVQPNIFLSQIKKFKIPIFSKKQCEEIERDYIAGLNKLENSKNLYAQAEDLLLEKLGLKDFSVKDDLCNIVNLSDAQKACRIDAEYFQPKYANLVSKIKNTKILGDLAEIKKGIEVGGEAYQEKGKQFFRVSNVSKQGFTDGNQQYVSDDLYQKLKNGFEPRIGEILLTKDATPGIAYVIKKNIQGIISSGILRLRIKIKIEPEYLALVLNLPIGQMQMERDIGGSIIVHWRPEQIKNCLIPVLPKSIQQKIAGLVQKSHQARSKAKQLLEQAKSRVENLIEK